MVGADSMCEQCARVYAVCNAIRLQVLEGERQSPAYGNAVLYRLVRVHDACMVPFVCSLPAIEEVAAEAERILVQTGFRPDVSGFVAGGGPSEEVEAVGIELEPRFRLIARVIFDECDRRSTRGEASE